MPKKPKVKRSRGHSRQRERVESTAVASHSHPKDRDHPAGTLESLFNLGEAPSRAEVLLFARQTLTECAARLAPYSTIRESGWDNSTLPYKPPRPVILFWLASQHDCGIRRVLVPDPNGYYWRLREHQQYYEEVITPIVLSVVPPPPRKPFKKPQREMGNQTNWEDLPPVTPPQDLERFIPAHYRLSSQPREDAAVADIFE